MELTKTKYKQTEVGLIPEDWKIISMSEITNLMTNGFVGTATSHYSEEIDSVLYIQGYNVKENSFNFNGIKSVSLEFHKRNKKSCLQEGDLLTVQTGDVGLTTIVPKELEGSNCHALIISRFNKKIAYPWYYAQYFNSFQGRSRLKELETGTTMKHINVGELVHWKVPLPPTLHEQKAIATALSDVDALISSLEKLIAKKKAIKQGAMQELLTPPHKGGKRLPGFSGEWKNEIFGEISFIKGRIGWQGLKQDEFTMNSSQPFLITGMNFKDGKIRWEEVYHVPYERYMIAKEIQLQKGDVLMTKDGTIGKLLYVDNIPSPGFATLNSHLLLFRPFRGAYVPKYLYFHLQSPEFKNHIEINKSGTTFFGISQESIEKYEIILPTYEEQEAIALILSDIDEEIEALEEKKTKYHDIKQGMMQELLTGKTRLV